MNDMERTLTVAVLIGMLVMIFVLSGKTNDLEDRVKQLEQVEEVKEIVSRGHGTGIGIGGTSMISTTGRVDAVGGCYSKGTARSYYHISDPAWR